MQKTAPQPSAVATTSSAAPTGSLAVMTAYACASVAIPVPFLPERLTIGLRGAAAHEIASRHGLSLTSDARAVLADPRSAQRTRFVKTAEGLARQILRKLRPLRVIDTVARGVEMYALGLLLERYITTVRPTGTVRIHVEEARRIRDLIDRSVVHAFSLGLEPSPSNAAATAEDLRDEFTRFTDAFLLTSASLVDYVERRLTAAFDHVIAESRVDGETEGAPPR